MATLIDADLLTAIVTPFDENKKIDFDSLEKLTNYLIEQGCNGFVIGGTTGETPTLTHDEKIELYKHFGQIVNGRAVVIAGTGSNNTAETIKLTALIMHWLLYRHIISQINAAWLLTLLQ